MSIPRATTGLHRRMYRILRERGLCSSRMATHTTTVRRLSTMCVVLEAGVSE